MKQGCLYQPPLTGEKNFHLGISMSSFMNHKHMEIEILYCMDGAANIEVNEKIYHVEQGEMLFVRPMEAHSIVGDRKNLLFVMEFSESFLGKEFSFFKETDFTERVYRPEGKTKELILSLYEMMNLRSDEDLTLSWKIRSALFEFAAVLSEMLKEPISIPLQTVKKSIAEKKMDRLFLYIHNNLQNEITLQTAAEVSGYEKKYVCRIFKEHTGLTFHKYINAYRIDRACIFIDSGKSLSEVRELVGLPDERTFIRVFIACKNMTPTQYKNRHENDLKLYVATE